MKLSMWMIANLLTSMEPELEIAEDAPITLNSARRAYATNCVLVYQDKDCVVCNGEGNMIRLHGMDETQAFEIVQGIFDFYEDWLDRITQAAEVGDFQRVVDQAWQAFHNPLILLDANNKVLGMTRQYDPESMDQEWRYLARYGYSSLNSIHSLRNNPQAGSFHHGGSQAFQPSFGKMMNFGGITCSLTFGELPCGRMNLLTKERPLNPGDYQLLDKITTLLAPYMEQHSSDTPTHTSNVFYDLLFGRVYEESMLDLQLDYQQWKREDSYYLALFHLTGTDDPKVFDSSLNLLMRTILQQFPHCVVLKRKPGILILSNWDLSANASFLQFLHTLSASNPVQVGFSLPCEGIEGVSQLHIQAEAALRYGNLRHPRNISFHFINYAIDFILSTVSSKDRLNACFPLVRHLWRQKKETGDEMYDTLKCYLDHERSVSKTSAALYTHRNTVMYRIRKVQDYLKGSLDDVYLRDYIRLSMRILELYEQEGKIT